MLKAGVVNYYSMLGAESITCNGPAIKLVNVTRRRRPVSTTPYYEENVSRPEKEGTARVFAIRQ